MDISVDAGKEAAAPGSSRCGSLFFYLSVFGAKQENVKSMSLRILPKT